ncbi:MAG: C40 family peptidase [Bacteroidetes bacterium]|nr:C40 family peptidase [Bacteroidota bacterium]
MKKGLVFCLTLIVSALSMQSCATDFVVAKPTIYNKEYTKDNTTLAISDKQIERNKKELISSFTSINQNNTLANNKNTSNRGAIERAIRHSKLIDGLLTEAETYLGTPYRFGGTTRRGIDCSAFVLSVFGAVAGLNLPRVAASQAHEGYTVNKEELQKGDLLFFSKGSRISHVGIVYDVTDGDVKFIHASTSQGVMVSTLNTDKYWGQKYRFAKRILDEENTDENTNTASVN